MKSLTIRNLSKTYFDVHAGANVTAVRDLSLEVPAGEFVSIVGPSGCGKTTLLNLLAIMFPDVFSLSHPTAHVVALTISFALITFFHIVLELLGAFLLCVAGFDRFAALPK